MSQRTPRPDDIAWRRVQQVQGVPAPTDVSATRPSSRPPSLVQITLRTLRARWHFYAACLYLLLRLILLPGSQYPLTGLVTALGSALLLWGFLYGCGVIARLVVRLVSGTGASPDG